MNQRFVLNVRVLIGIRNGLGDMMNTKELIFICWGTWTITWLIITGIVMVIQNYKFLFIFGIITMISMISGLIIGDVCLEGIGE